MTQSKQSSVGRGQERFLGDTLGMNKDSGCKRHMSKSHLCAGPHRLHHGAEAKGQISKPDQGARAPQTIGPEHGASAGDLGDKYFIYNTK